MTKDTIQQIAETLDAAFGRPGFTQFALARLQLLNDLAEAVRKEQEAAQAQQPAHDISEE